MNSAMAIAPQIGIVAACLARISHRWYGRRPYLVA